MRSLRLALPLVAALGFAGCTGPLQALRPTPGPVELTQTCNGAPLTLRYLGAGGLQLDYRGDSFLAAPFFSNPSLLRVGLGGAVANDDGAAAMAKLDVRRVRAVVAAQAHYDHLADIPALVPHLPAETPIWSNNTGVRLLEAAGVDPQRLHALNAEAGNWRRPGTWIRAGEHFRFMALHSEHAPHVWGMKFFTGGVADVPHKAPRSAYDFPEGQTFALLIDVLDTDKNGRERTVLRLHYQDAGSRPPYGFPPPLDDGKAVDIAVLCVASFEQIADYPEGIVRDLQPRLALLGHWEDFFRARDRPLRPVPFTDTEEFVRRLESALPRGSLWVTPEPGAEVRYGCIGE